MRQSHRIPAGAGMARNMLFLALGALLPAGVAHAARLEYDIGMRYMHSDNISLLSEGELSENILSPQVRFDFSHETSSVNAAIHGEVQHLKYLDGVYEDDTRGMVMGNVEWTILPDRLSFVVLDTLSEQSVDSLAAFTPGNQQQVNVFEAGPTFTARFNSVTRGQLDLRYINSWAEETESFNNRRYNAAARLLRQLERSDVLGLNLEATRVDYDTIPDVYDFRRYDAYVSYSSELSRLLLDVNAGYTRLKYRSTDSKSSTLFRAYATWEATPRSTISANLGYQFADAAQDLILNVSAPGGMPADPGAPVIGQPDNPGLVIIPDTFKQKRATLGYQFLGERLTLSAEPYYERIRYLQDDEFDANTRGVTVSASYRVGLRTTLLGLAQRYERDFVSTGRSDQDTILGAGVLVRFSRNWGAQFDVRRRERDSTIPGQDYTENVMMFSVTWFR